jgi:hypothetical protein
MNDRLNKNLVCSIVFIELIDFTQHVDAEQINIKFSLNQLINIALKEYARSDRVLLDKGDAIIMAYMAAPEDVLAIVVDIQNGIKQHNAQGLSPLFIRIGIHLSAVRVVKDINEQLNLIGKGLNEAQQVAQLAQANAIVVSEAFYAVSLPLPHAIAVEYVYKGLTRGSQVAEYNTYELGLISELNASAQKHTSTFTQKMDDNEVNTIDELTPMPAYQPAKTQGSMLARLNWKYIVAAVLIAFGIWMLVRLVSKPIEPKITLTEPALTITTQGADTVETKALSNKPADIVKEEPFNGLLPNESVEKLPEPAVATKQVATESSTGSSSHVKSAETVIEAKPIEVKKTVATTHKKQPDVLSADDKKLEVTTLQDETKVKSEPNKEPVRHEELSKDNIKQNQSDKEGSLEVTTKNKSGWEAFKDSLKQGKPSTCSQAETALGQCR